MWALLFLALSGAPVDPPAPCVAEGWPDGSLKESIRLRRNPSRNHNETGGSVVAAQGGCAINRENADSGRTCARTLEPMQHSWHSIFPLDQLTKLQAQLSESVLMKSKWVILANVSSWRKRCDHTTTHAGTFSQKIYIYIYVYIYVCVHALCMNSICM